MSRKTWIFGGVALGVVLAGVGLVLAAATGTSTAASAEQAREHKPAVAAVPGSEKPEAAEERAAVPVTVAPVTVRSIQRSVKIVGSFFGFDEVVVTPEVAGIAMKIHHDVGDVVGPGDLLVELDATDYELAAEEAQREMESELAKIGLEAMPAGKVDFEALPTVVRAKNVEANALSRAKRARELRSQGATSAEALESAETEYLVAEANRRQALLDARATLASARFKQAKYNVAMERVDDSRVKVPRPTMTTSRAVGDVPLEYVVAGRKITEGEMVMVTPLMSNGAFRLVLDKVLKYRGNVPERYVGEVKEGQVVRLTVDAFPGQGFEGKLTRVNPTVDRTNRTFEVEAVVPNASRTLKAGGFAEAQIVTRDDSEAVTVPTEAVITFVGSSRVFVVRDGKAHSVSVELGESGRGWVEIAGDFPRDALVITSGHTQLAEGVPVRVRSEGVAKR